MELTIGIAMWIFAIAMAIYVMRQSKKSAEWRRGLKEHEEAHR